MSDFSAVNIGAYNRLSYDNCAYQKRLYESTTPLMYNLYEGKFQNCDKCTYKNQFWRPFELVDLESELKNITRPNTKCPQLKYNPNCKKSKSCVSTFEPNMPVVLDSQVCPVVQNNIPRWDNPGYSVPTNNICTKNKVQQHATFQ
jgi:hypothetical protein